MTIANSASPIARETTHWLRRQFEDGGADLPRILGVLGSSRSDGKTGALARSVFSMLSDALLVDLNLASVAPYDYNHAHEDDDFLPIAYAMTKAEAIVFASPVYWYSMSAQTQGVF